MTMEMQSENIDKLAAALCKAQAEMPGSVKDGVNPHWKSKFSTLASAWNACRKSLTDNGLSISQFGWAMDGCPVMMTELIHVSGQWIRGYLPLVAKNQTDPQEICKAATYMRRKGIESMVGICPEDDDGEEAAGRKRNGKTVQQRKIEGVKYDSLNPSPTNGEWRKETAIRVKYYFKIPMEESIGSAPMQTRVEINGFINATTGMQPGFSDLPGYFGERMTEDQAKLIVGAIDLAEMTA